MTAAPRSAAIVIRRIVAALVLVPLAVVIVAFAVANRQTVTVSFDPFSAEHPAASMTLPLFALVIALLILGVMIGGAAAWLRHGRWRRAARRLERELGKLRQELDLHKRAAGAAPSVPQAAEPPKPPEPPERLQLRAPVR